MIGCQAADCEALSEVKIREVDTTSGEVIWWRYLCLAHLESEYGPWLALKRGWREALLTAS